MNLALYKGNVEGDYMFEDNIKIEEKKVVTFDIFRSNYDIYISNSKQEFSTIKEYQGRELLELIQNAEDECRNREGILKITLKDNILTIENSGKPFSFDGILSLNTPNFSPKESNNFIGNKGLGFRAVLSWSDEVQIHSKFLSVKYSKDDAALFQNELFNSVENKHKYKFDKYKLPVFSAPNTNIDPIEPSVGMDTLIRLSCKKDALERENGVISQLRSINGKELLFLKNIGTIIIEINEEDKKVFTITDEEYTETGFDNIYTKDALVSLNEDQDIYVYQIYQKRGEISFVDINNEHSESNYLISLAIPFGDAPIEKKLYSFFRTNVESPFNFILNATLELSQNRNYIINSVSESGYNYQVIDLLPDFIINSISHFFNGIELKDYSLLKFLVNNDKKFLTGEGYDFYNQYIKKLKVAKIFPNVNNEYIEYNLKPVLYKDHQFSLILEGKEFENLLQHTEDDEIISFYESLGVFHYNQESFTSKINSGIHKLELEDKVQLLIDFVDYYSTNNDFFPFLLVDSNNNNINEINLRVFNKPSSAEVSNIPTFLQPYLRFVNKEIFSILEEKIEFSTSNKIRESIDRYLKYYGVSEYSFSALSSPLNDTLKRTIEKDQSLLLLEWLFSLFSIQHSEDLTNISVRIPILSKDGGVVPSNFLYFDTEYDNEFYSTFLKTASNEVDFIETPEKLGLKDKEHNELIRFFMWLGVNNSPRTVQKTISGNSSPDELRNYISSCVKHYEINRILSDYRFSNNELKVRTYEFFEDIISNVPFDDVFIWMMEEHYKGNSLINNEDETSGSNLKATWFGKVNGNISYVYLKSYVRYKLLQLDWVVVTEGNTLQSPANCLLDKISLVPFLYTPKINYQEIKNYNEGFKKIDVDKLLSNIGITLSLKDLEYTRYYELLFELPNIDKNHNISRRVYENLKEKVSDDNNDYELFNTLDEYINFISNGKVLSKIGKNSEFYDVKKTYYSDKKDLCNGILDELHILDFARRSGEDKISNILGTTVFKNNKVKIIESKLHPVNNDFSDKLEKIKPYIALYRNDSSKMNEIKNIDIQICSSLKIKYSLNDTSDSEYVLQHYENIFSREKGKAYILVPSYETDENRLYNKYEFYESFAELITIILDVSREKEIYKNLIRDSLEISKRAIADSFGDKSTILIHNMADKLGLAYTPKELFWNVIDLHIDDDSEIIENKYKEINYVNLNSEENFSVFIKMFIEIGIDINTFNADSQSDYLIHIEEYVLKLIRERLKELYHNYLSYQYNLVKEDSQEQKYDRFVTLLDDYNFIYLDINKEKLNTIHFSIDQEISKVLEVESLEHLLLVDKVSIKEIQDENTRKYKSEYQEQFKKIKLKYDDTIIKEYSTFNELDILFNRTKVVEKEKPEANGKNEKKGLSTDEIQAKVNSSIISPNQGDISILDKGMKKDESEDKKDTKKGSGEYYGNTKKAQDNGCIAELFVYEYLVKEYGESVKWVSSNSKEFTSNKNPDDGCGYDIIYIDEKNYEKFVEVKSSVKKGVNFEISKNEVKVGLGNTEKYEIHFIHMNENQIPTEYWIIDDIFKFSDNEDFFNNSKFTIETSNYDICAKVKRRVK